MTTPRERIGRAEQQRRRRTSSRMCGRCGQSADVMVNWGPQSIPACRRCGDVLKNAAVVDIHCAFYEVLPQEVLPMLAEPGTLVLSVGAKEDDSTEDKSGLKGGILRRGRDWLGKR